jgi:hypothetical protein
MRTRLHLLLLVALLISSALLFSRTATSDSANAIDTLYKQFLDPPRDYSPMPFWFWNGKLDPATVQAEVRRMVNQHVYGAFLHARDGLLTPYLSEDWFAAIQAGLEESKRVGFSFNFVDEYSWPSGEVRNIWRADHHQSEVLARNPDFHMHSLAYTQQIIQGPQTVSLPPAQNRQSVVAAKWLGGGRIESGSRTVIPLPTPADGAINWQAPAGDWLIMDFHLEESMGLDGGVVDLMNPAAMKTYFDLSYGEYYKRFAPYFGTTIRYSFSDHEGDFGYRIGYTPALFEAFQKRNGYDLRPVLPLLVYDGSTVANARHVREDYLATITDLYQASYWSGITDAARKLGIGRSGHAWEETLQTGAIFEGSLFALERGLNPVGVDSLGDFGRQPLNFKVAQSVADFEGRRFACENQGVQGTDSYLDFQGLRKATNSIGAWGVNLFIPHAFDYDVKRANYAPDWLHQPYWPYFHYYADYTRRISWMNSEHSHHVTNVLLYYPMLSVWAESNPKFSSDTEYAKLAEPQYWKNRTTLINDYYTRMILRLSERQWDYNIADDYYFDQARIEGKELVIGPQRFSTIILPPITTIAPKTLAKILDFYRAGGTVIGIRMLPEAIDQTAAEAATITAAINELFGKNAASTPLPYTGSNNASGGKSFYVAESVETLVNLLEANATKDIRIVGGSSDHIYAQHRVMNGIHYYWFVNDTPQDRAIQVELSAQGTPEKWDALTGEHSPLVTSHRDISLTFAPWDAYFVVILPSTPEKTPTTKSIAAVVDEPKRISLADPWIFRPEPDHIPVPYAKVLDVPEPDAAPLREFLSKDFDDSSWSSLWLSEAQNTIRTWNVIGPFPNEKDSGFAQAFPPEHETAALDATAAYEGAYKQLVHWQRYYGDEPYLSKDVIWMETSGGPHDDDSPVVDLGRAFLLTDKPWVTAYAQTDLYSPIDQPATFVIAADNWAKVWLNGAPVFAQLRHPWWYEMNDNWADRAPVTLHKGWNSVLVKVGVGRGAATGQFGFTFRVADAQGRTLPGVVAQLAPNADGSAPAAATSATEATRFYRITIPPGTVGVQAAEIPPDCHPFVNGLAAGVSSASAPIRFQNLPDGTKNVFALECPASGRIAAPLEFVSGARLFDLQPWTKTGLANFSGTAIYEKSFTVPHTWTHGRIVLDLGKLSAVADVEVNGQQAGAVVWLPFQLDITKLIKPGENRLKIRVTNTEANARAVGASHNILANIDASGLEGPVTLTYTSEP